MNQIATWGINIGLAGAFVCFAWMMVQRLRGLPQTAAVGCWAFSSLGLLAALGGAIAGSLS